MKPIKYIPETLPHHFEHGGRVCKLWDAGTLYGLDLQEATETMFFKKVAGGVLSAINGFLYQGEIEPGALFNLVINQGYREVEVIEIKRNRARIEYEMPNAGMMRGWIPILQTPAGKVYPRIDSSQIDRGY